METATKIQQTWTVLSLIEWAARYLAERRFDDARLNVELLLSHVLQCKRIDLYLRFDKQLAPDQLSAFKSLFRRRLDHEPLQYITGETEFMGLRFRVDRRVLIPRPETEVLVEQVIAHLKARGTSNPRILEIGTGSGNIAVSLARNIPGSSITTIDCSGAALDVARENASSHGTEGRITFLHGNILEKNVVLSRQRFDLLVSNPPYISQKEFADLQPEVKEFEPCEATTDKLDGLTFFRRIVEIGKGLLAENGSIFVEIAYNQADAVRSLFRNSGYSTVDVVKDYEGNDRVVRVLLSEP